MVNSIHRRARPSPDRLPLPDQLGAARSAVEVVPGTGMSGGGALTGDVTVTLADTAVTPGSYGSDTAVPVVTVDQQGRVTNVSTASITTIPTDWGTLP